MTPDELEREGMAPAAVPHVLCGVLGVIDRRDSYANAEACVYLPHTEGPHSWQPTKPFVPIVVSQDVT